MVYPEGSRKVPKPGGTPIKIGPSHVDVNSQEMVAGGEDVLSQCRRRLIISRKKKVGKSSNAREIRANDSGGKKKPQPETLDQAKEDQTGSNRRDTKKLPNLILLNPKRKMSVLNTKERKRNRKCLLTGNLGVLSGGLTALIRPHARGGTKMVGMAWRSMKGGGWLRVWSLLNGQGTKEAGRYVR